MVDGSVLSMLAMNYMGISFALLTYEKGMTFSRAMNHYVFILIVALLLVFRLGKIPQRAAKLEAKLKETADKKQD